jgi:hypothetical protein
MFLPLLSLDFILDARDEIMMMESFFHRLFLRPLSGSHPAYLRYVAAEIWAV